MPTNTVKESERTPLIRLEKEKSRTPHAKQNLLHELFSAQARKNPNRPAIISDSQSLSFGELDNLSNRLAAKLRSLGATSNTLVAVVMEKGWEQIVAVLGILRAGAAYLPIDAGLPNDRIQKLLKNGEATIALTQPRYLGATEWPAGVRPLALREEEINAFPPLTEELDISSEQLAYVIYTSGSTGEPKGVMIDHRGAVNTILDINSRFAVTAADRMLALSSLSFDLSVYDIFGSLGAGAAMVIPKAESTRDPSNWADLLNRHKVTIWNSVPALMDLLADYLGGHPQAEPRSLRLALLSGDWIPLGLPDAIRKFVPALSVVSLGGATEASIWSILYPIHSMDPNCSSIPYGRAMKNQEVQVLDPELLPCAPGIPGELFISGIGLAKGYWRDPQRTAECFLDHPLTGERLYRTGDNGRYLPDGNIEFLGRSDMQVKLQGFRVELGEIEATLVRHRSVAKAVVVVNGQREARKRLVAYLVAEEDARLPSTSDLQDFLARQLPDYMIPATYVELDGIPLTPNGKVDRRALPEPPDNSAPFKQPKAEETASLSQMRQLVADALEQDNLDTDANLLELGLNSIDMIRIANRVDEALGFRPSVFDFYQDPSIAGLARSYEEYRRSLGNDV
ncbi:MAG TPA: amino acid adenylation domain-containing protein [Terrimicrobiaceae bacterium]